MRSLILLLFITSLLPIRAQLSAHPNPFSEKTVISFTVPAADTIAIHVINPLGMVIDTLHPATPFAAGNYADTLYMNSHQDGIYFVTFQASQTKHIIKLVKSKGVSLEEHRDAPAVIIAPNPSSAGDVVKILAGDQGVRFEDISLTDITGRVIRILAGATGSPPEIAHLEAGIYLLKVTANGQTRTIKLIRH